MGSTRLPTFVPGCRFRWRRNSLTCSSVRSLVFLTLANSKNALSTCHSSQPSSHSYPARSRGTLKIDVSVPQGLSYFLLYQAVPRFWQSVERAVRGWFLSNLCYYLSTFSPLLGKCRFYYSVSTVPSIVIYSTVCVDKHCRIRNKVEHAIKAN